MRLDRFFLRAADWADQVFNLRARDTARAQQKRLFLSKRDHRGFDSDRARAAVEDIVDAIAQASAHMFRRGWGKHTEAIGARRSDGNLRRFNQGERNWMVGHAYAYGRQTSSDDRRNGGLFQQHQG